STSVLEGTFERSMPRNKRAPKSDDKAPPSKSAKHPSRSGGAYLTGGGTPPHLPVGEGSGASREEWRRWRGSPTPPARFADFFHLTLESRPPGGLAPPLGPGPSTF